jgi:hypothetical protein
VSVKRRQLGKPHRLRDSGQVACRGGQKAHPRARVKRLRIAKMGDLPVSLHTESRFHLQIRVSLIYQPLRFPYEISVIGLAICTALGYSGCLLLVRLDHIASFIVNANHRNVRVSDEDLHEN